MGSDTVRLRWPRLYSEPAVVDGEEGVEDDDGGWFRILF